MEQTSLRTITYFVNSARQHTQEHALSVRTILVDAGFTPAENFQLERDAGHHIYTDLNEIVSVHEDEHFTALYTGPTPTS